jgi:hypothetical protein
VTPYNLPHFQGLGLNGKPGQVSVVEINGRSYVDLEALARVANGSLGFKKLVHELIYGEKGNDVLLIKYIDPAYGYKE